VSFYFNLLDLLLVLLIQNNFMRKLSALLFVFFLLSSNINAQKGENLLSIGGDLGLPTGDFAEGFNVGPGLRAKLLFGINTTGYITATSGINFFSAKPELLNTGASLTFRIIPILAGYRHTINSFFIEPQFGFGVYSATVSTGGTSESGSTNAFTWAAAMGYMGKSFEAGVRYQSGEKDGSISMIGINISYIFSLGRSRK
jgi:hypothetical protein